MKKRAVSLALAILMAAAMIPAPVFAAVPITVSLVSGDEMLFSDFPDSPLVYKVTKGSASSLSVDLDGSKEGIVTADMTSWWEVTVPTETLDRFTSAGAHVIKFTPDSGSGATRAVMVTGSAAPFCTVSSGSSEIVKGSAETDLEVTVTSGTGKYACTGISAVSVDSSSEGLTFFENSLAVSVSALRLSALSAGTHDLVITVKAAEGGAPSEITLPITVNEGAAPVLNKVSVPKDDTMVKGAALKSLVLTLTPGTGRYAGTGVAAVSVNGTPLDASCISGYAVTVPASVLNALAVGPLQPIEMTTAPAPGCDAYKSTYYLTVAPGSAGTLSYDAAALSFPLRNAPSALAVTLTPGTGEYVSDGMKVTLDTTEDLSAFVNGLILTLGPDFLNSLPAGGHTLTFTPTHEGKASGDPAKNLTVTVLNGTLPAVNRVSGELTFIKGMAAGDLILTVDNGTGDYLFTSYAAALDGSEEGVSVTGTTVTLSKALLCSLTSGGHSLVFTFKNGSGEAIAPAARTVGITVSEGRPASCSPEKVKVAVGAEAPVTFTVTSGTGPYACDGIGGVSVDGEAVPAGFLSLLGLSVTISADFLKTLTGGEHTLSLTLKNGGETLGTALSAVLSVGKTPAPVFENNIFAMTSAKETKAVFKLTEAYSGAVSVRLYYASGDFSTPITSGVSAALSGDTLTLTFDPAPTATRSMLVSVTQSGSTESDKTYIGVKAFSNDSVATLKSVSYTVGAGTAAAVADFDPDVPVYDIYLPSDTQETASVTVSPVPTFEGETVLPGTVTLTDGRGTVSLAVTSKDGSASRAYVFNFCIIGKEIVNWDLVAEKIKTAAPGSQITVAMGEETFVPAKVIEVLMGKNVFLNLTFAGTADFTSIRGTDVRAAADTRADFTVGGSTVPSSYVKAVTVYGRITYPALELAMAGPSEDVPVAFHHFYGTDYTSAYINRFSFKGTLALTDAERVNRAGYVSMTFTAPGTYLLVADSRNRTWSETLGFTDVSTSDWFYKSLYLANKLGFISGKSASSFAPRDNLTVAEAVKLSVNLYELLNGGKLLTFKAETGIWYQTFIDRAIELGIIARDQFESYDAAATRAQVASVFYKVLISSDYPVLNSVGDDMIPDVKAADTDPDTYAAIYGLYRAGLLVGDAASATVKKGTFRPDSTITRAEIAAITVRLYYDDCRVLITL